MLFLDYINARHQSTFHSMKNSSLQFQDFPVRNEQHFPEFLEKTTTFRGIPKFPKFFAGNFRSIFTLYSHFINLQIKCYKKGHARSQQRLICIIWLSFRNLGDVRLNGSLFGNSTFSEFSGNFPRIFPYHLSPVKPFRNVRLNGKCPG